jgi:mannonate dehydratase
LPVISCKFSIAGVGGWNRQPEARGRAMTTVFDMTAIDPNEPIPDGMVWNMRYRDGRAKAPPVRVTDEDNWDRLAFFMSDPVRFGS